MSYSTGPPVYPLSPRAAQPHGFDSYAQFSSTRQGKAAGQDALSQIGSIMSGGSYTQLCSPGPPYTAVQDRYPHLHSMAREESYAQPSSAQPAYTAAMVRKDSYTQLFSPQSAYAGGQEMHPNLQLIARQGSSKSLPSSQPTYASGQDAHLRGIVREEVRVQMMAMLSELSGEDCAALLHGISQRVEKTTKPTAQKPQSPKSPKTKARESNRVREFQRLEPVEVYNTPSEEITSSLSANAGPEDGQAIDEELLDSMFGYLLWKVSDSDSSARACFRHVAMLVGLLLVESILVFAFADCFVSRFVVGAWAPNDGLLNNKLDNNCLYQGRVNESWLKYSKVVLGMPSIIWAAAVCSFLIIGLSMRDDDKEMLARRHLQMPSNFNIGLRLLIAGIRAIRAVYLPPLLLMGIGFMVVESNDVGDMVINSVAAVFLLDLDSEIFRTLLTSKEKAEYHKKAMSKIDPTHNYHERSSSSDSSSDDENSPKATKFKKTSKLIENVTKLLSSSWTLYVGNMGALLWMFLAYNLGQWEQDEGFQDQVTTVQSVIQCVLILLRAASFTVTGMSDAGGSQGVLEQRSMLVIGGVFLCKLFAVFVLVCVYDDFLLAPLFGEDTNFDYPSITACLNGADPSACSC